MRIVIALLLDHFQYTEQPAEKQGICAEFYNMARKIAGQAPDSPDTERALERLVEARAWALLAKTPPPPSPAEKK